MRNKVVKNKLFSRRVLILGSLHFLVTALFTTRLYYLQIKKNQKYKFLSDNNRTKIVLTPPIRGNILDRNGVELANNKIAYKVLCDLQYVENLDVLIENLVKITKIEPKKILSNKLKNYKNPIVTLYEEISWNALSGIQFNIKKLQGIYIASFYKRYYPYGSSCSHIIGYTKTYNQSEIFTNNSKIGISGIEYVYDEKLKGVPGIVEQEVNAKRQIIRELSNVSSRPGLNIKLTINIKLQKTVSEMLGNNSASVIVLDIKTGEILSLCTAPTYDNNMFIGGFSSVEWQKLNDNPELPLINRAISLQTEPASSFKIITALAALKEGIIDYETEFNCQGSVVVGDTVFRCWNHKGHGVLKLDEAITSSCNCYFYNIGQKINIDTIVDMAYKFGFAQLSKIDLLGEMSGILPDKIWRKKKLKGVWQLGDTLNVVIGHGYILTTPLQLALFASRIATGKVVIPRITDKGNNAIFSDLNVDTNHLSFIRKAMFNVVNTKYGTAYQYLKRTGLTTKVLMSGKTGSAQVISTKSDNIKLLKDDKKHRDHGIFIGYAPSDKPRYAISVFMGHIGGAGKAVATAQKIFNHIDDIIS